MTDANTHKKAVYDTGIVLQAALSNLGPAFTCLRLMDEERIIVMLSPQVWREYENILTRPSIRAKNPLLTEERVRMLLERIDEKAHHVTVIRPYLQYPRDHNDEPILNLAIQEQVDYLVSRDKDLLDLARSSDFRLLYPYLKVMDPLTFVRKIMQEQQEQAAEQNSKSSDE